MREDDETINLTYRVSLKQFDDICANAKRDRVSIAEWIRRRCATDDDRRDGDK